MSRGTPDVHQAFACVDREALVVRDLAATVRDAHTGLVAGRASILYVYVDALITTARIEYELWPNSLACLGPAGDMVYSALCALAYALQDVGETDMAYECFWRGVCLDADMQMFSLAYGQLRERTAHRVIVDLNHRCAPARLRALYERLRAYVGPTPALDALLAAPDDTTLLAGAHAAAAAAAATLEEPVHRAARILVGIADRLTKAPRR